MEWLNYHHLFYFWMVAKKGSIARACEELRLAQPTISGQLRVFEETLGEKLFARQGRRLVLTESGQVVYRYAEEIFALGAELTDTLRGRPRNRPLRLLVGVSDLIPKLIAYRILQPALGMKGGVHIECYEDTPDKLLLSLSAHELDLVLTDAPAHSLARVKVFNHLLGSSGLALFASPPLADFYRRRFPASLSGAPFLLPMKNSALRQTLDQWFEAHSIHPRVLGEFQDTALLTAFGQAGNGIFAAPTAIEREVRSRYRVAKIGDIAPHVTEYYAVSAERRIKHPAANVIAEVARNKLFAAKAV
ncbi:MAG TPA: transcriptional activator NhaR [Bryobacteraceae bacterium]|nr:transcriptional activator NhaR [Bryobacteraceae bacterium]